MFIFEIYKNANPDHIALVGDRTLTYGEMDQQIKRYRNVLYKKGVHQGDRVAIYSGNCIQFVLAYMAITSLGAIVVPVNFSLVDIGVYAGGGQADEHVAFSDGGTVHDGGLFGIDTSIVMRPGFK